MTASNPSKASHLPRRQLVIFGGVHRSRRRGGPECDRLRSSGRTVCRGGSGLLQEQELLLVRFLRRIAST